MAKRTADALSILRKDNLINDHDIELILEKLMGKVKGTIKVVR